MALVLSVQLLAFDVKNGWETIDARTGALVRWRKDAKK